MSLFINAVTCLKYVGSAYYASLNQSIRDTIDGIGCYSIAQFFVPDSTEIPSLRFGKWESAAKLSSGCNFHLY